MKCVAQPHDSEHKVGSETGIEAVGTVDVGPLVSENTEDLLSRFEVVGQAKRHEEHAKGVVNAHAREAEAFNVGAEDVAVVLLGKVRADLIAVEFRVLEDCRSTKSAPQNKNEGKQTH